MKIRFLCVLALALFVSQADAQFLFFGRNKKKATADTTAVNKKKKPEPKVREGFFSVAEDDGKWLFEIPDSILGVPFLAVTRYVSTPVGLGVYGGEMVSSQLLYWQKVGKKLNLRMLVHDSTSPDGDAIGLAVRASAEDPILEAFDIKKTLRGKADTAAVRYRIDVSEMLVKSDNVVTGLPSAVKNRLNVSSYKSAMSYVDRVDTYPINTEIESVKTYTSAAKVKAPSGRMSGLLTFRLNTSFVMLPKEPMRRRFFDERVGYFTESDVNFDDSQQQVRRRHFAARWRLEPKSEADLAKVRRGELIEPKNPIVYYIDPATPPKWRPYLIQGVNDWNVAFEQAGWKNAIRGEMWPEDDTTMHMGDARYSLIRYLASSTENAYGPHISDPRTGEILNTNIGWYHNVMKLCHDWYAIQVGAVDPRARTMSFPDDLMGELVRFVSSHEVGHTLGLRHNMGASSCTPVDSLRDKAWVEKNGHTVSIMDYARFNYVAQPEDGIGPDGLMPRINVYDKWAIEWGYKLFPDAADDEAERLLLNKLTVERLKDRRLWFGGEGNDNDPRALTEDLGDDNIRAAEFGILNLKRILPQLPQWAYAEADDYTNLEQLYSGLLKQFRRYVGHATGNLAGVYHDYKSVEQDGPVYSPAEKSRTRRALDFLDAQVLTEPSWLIEPDFLLKLTSKPQDRIRGFGESAVSNILSKGTLSRVAAYSSFPQAYALGDYMDDAVSLIFREVYRGGRVSSWRAAMQRKGVDVLLGNLNTVEGDARPYVLRALLDLQRRMTNAGTDSFTRAHFADLARVIRLGVEESGKKSDK